MIRAHIIDRLDGVAIALVLHPAEGDWESKPRVLRLPDGDCVAATWEEVDPHIGIEKPTLILNQDVARELLDGLTRHFQGAEDSRMLRGDYNAERKRVDTLVGILGETLTRLSAPPGQPAEPPRFPR